MNRFVTTVFLSVMALGAVYSLVVLIDQRAASPQVFAIIELKLPPANDDLRADMIPTTIRVLHSQALIRETLKVSAVAGLPLVQTAPDPVVWMAERLHVERDLGAPATSIRISMHGDDAKQMIVIVDTLINVYWDWLEKTYEAPPGDVPFTVVEKAQIAP